DGITAGAVVRTHTARAVVILADGAEKLARLARLGVRHGAPGRGRGGHADRVRLGPGRIALDPTLGERPLSGLPASEELRARARRRLGSRGRRARRRRRAAAGAVGRAVRMALAGAEEADRTRAEAVK